MSKSANTPACDHLFKTRNNAAKLDKKAVDLLYHVTVQLLYVCK